ncbi:hypothetical protein HELRODRAFT_95981 [Helobdella robusta]|uniref:Uncharacterized protein n=1 Tax=Helobdella robusta TaxID=6412 RepID=T1G996_HELRO|nr:hypothetical protein HELRODRAFT_95981 [Helobdella robusta]ESN92670.1 hypothetical protein HELRODRAFT_95981 [Helobdella robusta]
MKHIKRNKQGFVSLKVISSFHKMKRLTNDHRVVAYALEHSSKKLQVSENKNKVKRIDPLPRTSDKMSAEDCSKSVIATPVLSTSVEELKRSFEKCGKVLRVSVFTDDNFPPWLKTILNKNRTYHLPFAIVEYDNIESAGMASKVLTNTSDWRRGMKVDVLMKPAKNKPESKEKENKQNLGDPVKPQKKKKKSKKKDQQAAAHRIAELQTTISSSGSDLDKTTTGTQVQPDRGGIPIPTSPRQNINYSKSFGCSPTKSGAHQHSQPQHLIPATRHGGLAKSPLTYELEDGTRLRSSSFGPLSSSPGRWLQKKLQVGGSGGGGSASASITTVVTAGLTGSSEHYLSAAATTNTATKEEQKTEFSHKKFTEGLIRMPRGPDGTRGFRLKRTIVQ